MDKLKNTIKKLYQNSIVRYVFFGGLTTAVNIVSFMLLRKAGVPLNIANIISIILAVLFAYIVNSAFVFHARSETWKGNLFMFVKFAGGRGVTMVVEIAGVWFLAEIIHLSDFWAKSITQVVVLILNYIISKYFVFRKTRQTVKKT